MNNNGAANINVIVGNDSAWTITEESVINYLKVDGTVNGTLVENEDGTITLMPGNGTIPAGVYGEMAVAGASASGEMGSGEPS